MSVVAWHDDDRSRLRLWLRMLRTTRAVERQLRERLSAEFGTTLPRFDVMAALDRAPAGMMMGELSRFLLVSNGNVTGIVERLVADGLVTRNPRDGDRRAAIVRLTENGRSAFAAMAAANARWIDELLGGVTAAEAKQMTAILGSFRSQWEDRQ
ncbi:MarR family winged helix-turn-helix transcriptional regulator [Sphingomonas sp.]|uniref:MarR family winged helix-turn-helix transcriptional regulator n=1 Tax=Sphingomonas sp. TaxID=28214 RepID=UPI002E310E37|nr:MarR family transcriptional regulator [Sphingomonas sp.]HEX4695193.1 MarR family transcriptional regulator [Sphingomonas sp.]